MTDQPYDGVAAPGGPAVHRDVPGARISKISVGPFDNNAYVLTCAQTGQQLLIDAAAEPDRLLPLLHDVQVVLTTHQHADHWQALAAVTTALRAAGQPARTAAHPADAGGIPVPTDLLLDDGDVVTVGALQAQVRHVTGHTPGSLVVTVSTPDGPHVFSGDCLFPGGVGNTEKDPQRFAALLGDVETKIFDVLPDRAWVYPGHGRDTTVGAERPQLAEWRQRGW